MTSVSVILRAAVLTAVVTAGAHAHADALTDFLGPRAIAVGEGTRADARGVLSTTLNPAGLAMNRELAFEGSYGYRFADGGSALTVSGCDSTVPIPGCFYYRYLHASPQIAGMEQRQRVHEGGSSLARSFADRVFTGINVKYFDYEVGPDTDDNGFAVDFGAAVKIADIMNIGLVGYNLVGADSAYYPRALAAGIILRPLGSLTIGFDSLWHLDVEDDQSTGRYGGGLEYFIRTSDQQTGFPIRLGVVHDAGLDSTLVSAGLGVMTAKVALDVGAQKQLDSDAIIIQASLRIFGPRQIPGTFRYQ